MIKNRDVACQISDLMIEFSKKIDNSVRLVQEQCSVEEFRQYRLAAGRVLGEILLEIMNPLYGEHPGLKPEGLD